MAWHITRDIDVLQKMIYNLRYILWLFLNICAVIKAIYEAYYDKIIQINHIVRNLRMLPNALFFQDKELFCPEIHVRWSGQMSI